MCATMSEPNPTTSRLQFQFLKKVPVDLSGLSVLWWIFPVCFPPRPTTTGSHGADPASQGQRDHCERAERYPGLETNVRGVHCRPRCSRHSGGPAGGLCDSCDEE